MTPKDSLLGQIEAQWVRISDISQHTLTVYWRDGGGYWHVKVFTLDKVYETAGRFKTFLGWELAPKDYAEIVRIRKHYESTGTVTEPWNVAKTPREQVEMCRLQAGHMWEKVDLYAPGKCEKRYRVRMHGATTEEQWKI